VIELTWWGHSTVALDIGGCRLLTDPLLHRWAGPLQRRDRGAVPSPEAWTGTDLVLLSHLHHDHADLRSLRRLGQVPILTGRRNAEWLRTKGLAGTALDGWTRVGDVGVRLVPAVHRSRRMPHRPNDAHGHLVVSPDAAVWVAGDTSLYAGMSDLPGLADRRRIDVAVVPIGGWGPRLSPGHLGPEEAAVACAWTRARYAVPVHWGTFHLPPMGFFGSWMRRPVDEFSDALRRTAPACRLVRLEQGRTWTWRPGEERHRA
jgi:L-ascorbate metabolism protein UlaG (beta-lactamase superfamily)